MPTRTVGIASSRRGTRRKPLGHRIDGDLVVPDPASRFQPDDVHGLASWWILASYTWSDTSWTGRSWEEAVLYEVHVGTASPEGTYAGLSDRLEFLRDLGITAIEIMPVAEFPGRGTGAMTACCPTHPTRLWPSGGFEGAGRRAPMSAG